MPFLHTEYSLKECPFFSSPGPLKRTLDGILGAVSFLYSVQILRTLRMGCLPPSLLVGSVLRLGAELVCTSGLLCANQAGNSG
jgi:hypothetical protein